MTQLPILSGREVIRILERIGYRAVRQRGSHIRLTCPGRKPVTIPNYKTIDRSLLRKILRDAELTVAELEKLTEGYDRKSARAILLNVLSEVIRKPGRFRATSVSEWARSLTVAARNR